MPLLRPARHDSQIHGPDGLGGVEGLPSADLSLVRARIDDRSAIDAIANAVRQTWNDGAGVKVTIVASGPLTNVALFVSVHPNLLHAIERIVFMGGGIGIGNRSAVAGRSRTFGCRCPFCRTRSPDRTALCGQNSTFCAIVSPMRLFFCSL